MKIDVPAGAQISGTIPEDLTDLPSLHEGMMVGLCAGRRVVVDWVPECDPAGSFRITCAGKVETTRDPKQAVSTMLRMLKGESQAPPPPPPSPAPKPAEGMKSMFIKDR